MANAQGALAYPVPARAPAVSGQASRCQRVAPCPRVEAISLAQPSKGSQCSLRRRASWRQPSAIRGAPFSGGDFPRCTVVQASAASSREAQMEALLFDCDGVLVDTERDGHRVSFNQAFQQVSKRTIFSPRSTTKSLCFSEEEFGPCRPVQCSTGSGQTGRIPPPNLGLTTSSHRELVPYVLYRWVTTRTSLRRSFLFSNPQALVPQAAFRHVCRRRAKRVLRACCTGIRPFASAGLSLRLQKGLSGVDWSVDEYGVLLEIGGGKERWAHMQLSPHNPL